MPSALKIPLLWFAGVVAALLVVSGPATAGAPTLTERATSVLLSRPRHSSDAAEDPRDREARLREEASAVVSGVLHASCKGAWLDSGECPRLWKGDLRELVAAELTLIEHESHAARFVANACAGGPSGSCDSGDARTLLQVHQALCPDAWNHEVGSDAEKRTAAYCAAKQLAWGLQQCTERGAPANWAGAFGKYAGRGCKWDGGAERAATMRRVLAKL